MENKDGEPAFPHTGNGMIYFGMTLRDYFAAHCPITLTEFMTMQSLPMGTSPAGYMLAYATLRWEYATLMIAQRNKQPVS